MKSNILKIITLVALSALSMNAFAEMGMSGKGSDFMQMDKMMSKAENTKDKE